jgi:hypothetical protein
MDNRRSRQIDRRCSRGRCDVKPSTGSDGASTGLGPAFAGIGRNDRSAGRQHYDRRNGNKGRRSHAQNVSSQFSEPKYVRVTRIKIPRLLRAVVSSQCKRAASPDRMPLSEERFGGDQGPAKRVSPPICPAPKLSERRFVRAAALGKVATMPVLWCSSKPFGDS